MQPEPKLVLITGAGSGIGRALCIEAAQRGMTVALCGRRRDALAATHLIIPADITRSEDRRRIVDRIRSERGSLDVLINNAGIVEGGPLEKFDDDALARTFQTNVIAPIALTRDLMPLLIAAKPSRVAYAAPRATRTDAADAFAGLIAKTKMSMDSPEQVARQIRRAIASGHDSV